MGLNFGERRGHNATRGSSRDAAARRDGTGRAETAEDDMPLPGSRSGTSTADRSPPTSSGDARAQQPNPTPRGGAGGADRIRNLTPSQPVSHTRPPSGAAGTTLQELYGDFGTPGNASTDAGVSEHSRAPYSYQDVRDLLGSVWNASATTPGQVGTAFPNTVTDRAIEGSSATPTRARSRSVQRDGDRQGNHRIGRSPHPSARNPPSRTPTPPSRSN